MNRLAIDVGGEAAGLLRAAFCVLGVCLLSPVGGASSTSPAAIVAGVPLAFERVEDGPAGRFRSRLPGFALEVEAGGASLWLRRPTSGSPLLSLRTPVTMRFRLLEPDALPSGVAEQETPTRLNYLLGNEAAAWRTGVVTHARVRFPDVYDGVDVVYYGNGQQLEYDFEVGPGVDPGRIGFRIEGADSVELTEEGNLRLLAGAAEVQQRRPVAYQEVDGRRSLVPAWFVPDDEDPRVIRFGLGEYDASLPLVIDPVVLYAAYFGGSAIDLFRRAMLMPSGELVVVGETASFNIPVRNPIEITNVMTVTNLVPGEGLVVSTVPVTNYSGATNSGGPGSPFGNPLGIEAMVARFSADGQVLEYATYLGGSTIDAAMDVTLDPEGNLLVYGMTQSPDFPVVTGVWSGIAYRRFPTTNSVVATNAIYRTDTIAVTNVVDGTNVISETNVVVWVTNRVTTNLVLTTRLVTTNTWPVPEDWQTVFNTNITGNLIWGYYLLNTFLTRLTPEGDRVLFSAYQGDIYNDQGMRVAVGPEGRTYLLMYREYLGDLNPYVYCIQSNELVYLAESLPSGLPLALEPLATGEVWIGGQTSSNFLQRELEYWPPGDPFAPYEPYQRFPRLFPDAYVLRLSPEGEINYYTYLSGDGSDGAVGVRAESDGGVTVVGNTTSRDFPVAAALFPTNSGFQDWFVSRLDGSLTNLVFSTYLGGSFDDTLESLRRGADGELLMAGRTLSQDFPAAQPLASSTAGSSDGVVVGMAGDGSTLDFSSYVGGPGRDVAYDVVRRSDGLLWVVGSTQGGLEENYGDLVKTNWWNLTSTPGATPLPISLREPAAFLAEMYVGEAALSIGVAPSGGLGVRWPAILVGYDLQGVAALNGTNIWSDLSPTVLVGTNWVYEVTEEEPQEFFRLLRPPGGP